MGVGTARPWQHGNNFFCFAHLEISCSPLTRPSPPQRHMHRRFNRCLTVNFQPHVTAPSGSCRESGAPTTGKQNQIPSLSFQSIKMFAVFADNVSHRLLSWSCTVFLGLSTFLSGKVRSWPRDTDKVRFARWPSAFFPPLSLSSSKIKLHCGWVDTALSHDSTWTVASAARCSHICPPSPPPFPFALG